MTACGQAIQGTGASVVPSITRSEEGHVNLEAHLGAEANRWYQCQLVMGPLEVDALT